MLARSVRSRSARSVKGSGSGLSAWVWDIADCPTPPRAVRLAHTHLATRAGFAQEKHQQLSVICALSTMPCDNRIEDSRCSAFVRIGMELDALVGHSSPPCAAAICNDTSPTARRAVHTTFAQMCRGEDSSGSGLRRYPLDEHPLCV